MVSEAQIVEIKAYVWDEGGAPVEMKWDGPDDFDRIQHKLIEHLETKEYGKIVRTYPKTADQPGGELVLFYRALTDEFRGRMVVSGIDQKHLDKTYMERKRYCEQKVFSPAELYALKPIRIDNEVDSVIRVHIPEIDVYDIDTDVVMESKRMEYRELVYHSSDGYRTWELGSVWFDGKPVMVVNNSGRGGDEYSERWITDGALYSEMIVFLRTFMHESEVACFVKADTKIPAMTEFYGSTIHDFYNVDKQEAKK